MKIEYVNNFKELDTPDAKTEKNSFRKLLNKWRYYGLGKDEYKKNIEIAFVKNISNLRWTNMVVAILTALFAIFPIVTENDYIKAGFYGATSVTALLICIFTSYKHYQFEKENNLSVNLIFALILIYYVNIIMFGLYLAVWANPGKIAGSSIGIIICALFMLNISPILYLSLILGTVASYIICVIQFKIPSVWNYDIQNAIFAGAMALIFGWQIIMNRLKALSFTNKLENEANKIIGHREKMLRALYEMAFILLSHNDTLFDNILSASLKPIANAINIDKITIYKYVYTDTDKYIEPSYRWKKKEGEFILVDEKMKILPDIPLTRKWLSSLEKGIDINIHIGIMSEDEKNFFSTFGTKSILMTPVFIKGELWGTINFSDHINERLFDEVSIDMMHSAAHLLTDAILREQLYLDALTGIHNRRYFNEKATILFKNLTRSNSMLSVVMIDIDFFKNYNDTYGHREGDNCLKIIAQTISKSVIRESDFSARYGGEEFVVVLPNTGDNGAHVVAKRLIENIRNCNIPYEKSTVAAFVTISIGVAVGKVDCTQSFDDYIKRADELLYISKKDGRNRYTIGMI